MDIHPIATIAMQNGGQIVIELLPESAPNTCASFITLANSGAFDGHAIERIVPGYVADMSYTAFGRDECKYLIPFETTSHGFPNTVPVSPGVIAMGGYAEGIAGGEFFFPLAESDKLTGNYPAFGRIISGLDIVLSWEKVPLKKVSVPGVEKIQIFEPIEPIIKKSVRVETFGQTIPEVIKLPILNPPITWR